MTVGAGGRVAAGAHQVVEYLLAPRVVKLPLTPAHCPGMLVWRDNIIPAMDLGVLFGRGQPQLGESRNAVVLAYQHEPLQPLRHGAVLVETEPREVHVSDDLACPLPESPGALRYWACSCFRHEEDAVPVIDPAYLFGRPPPGQPHADIQVECRMC